LGPFTLQYTLLSNLAHCIKQLINLRWIFLAWANKLINLKPIISLTYKLFQKLISTLATLPYFFG
jgi:hypothetical protein